eukprot:393602-Rhodomonas_salina.4
MQSKTSKKKKLQRSPGPGMCSKMLDHAPLWVQLLSPGRNLEKTRILVHACERLGTVTPRRAAEEWGSGVESWSHVKRTVACKALQVCTVKWSTVNENY